MQYYQSNHDSIIDSSREYHASHRAEDRERSQQYYLANPEGFLSRANNRRAHKKNNGGVHTAEDIKAQYERQKGTCFYCGKKVGKKYHVDHVIPISRGGYNGPENLVISCPKCNLSKGTKHPMDFCGRLL